MKALRALACGFIAWTGCAGTETGNPVEGSEQDVHLAYAPLSTRIALLDGTPVMVDDAGMQLRSVALEACSGQTPVALARARELDLLAADADVASVPAARYCGLRIALGGASDELSASRASANGEISVAFASRLELDVRVWLREPIEIGAEPVYWIVGVDLQQWAEPLDAWLSGREASFIGTRDNAELLEAIIRSIAIYDDLDQDTEADAAELTSPLSRVERAAAQRIPGAI